MSLLGYASSAAAIAPRSADMIKSIAFVSAACGVVVVSAAIPHGAAIGAATALDEPGSMLVLAMALFGLASAVRRHGKRPDRP
jgi:hypothetical protein